MKLIVGLLLVTPGTGMLLVMLVRWGWKYINGGPELEDAERKRRVNEYADRLSYLAEMEVAGSEPKPWARPRRVSDGPAIERYRGVN